MNEKYDKKNFNKKEKFVNTLDRDLNCETAGFWKYEKKWDVIDAETNLKTPSVGTRNKMQAELTSVLHPSNLEIPMVNTNENSLENKFYYSTYDLGPGRGFGNLNVSNSIRIGDYTRTETKNFRAQKESKTIERWEFIDGRFQNPNNLILPIPRGGESTRKNQQPLNNDNLIKTSFEFKY